jgi:hypothetical protein
MDNRARHKFRLANPAFIAVSFDEVDLGGAAAFVVAGSGVGFTAQCTGAGGKRVSWVRDERGRRGKGRRRGTHEVH